MTLILACAVLLAIDGDTLSCDGVSMRDMGSGQPGVSGFDTPEIRNAQCDAERTLGFKAKFRYQELLDLGVTVLASGKADRFGRPLVSVRSSDGTALGDILIREGLAVEWPNEKDWCAN